ncbi:MAG: DNA polymerase III subunit delta' [Hyphomicrobiales bacterium]|nr:DNA polymerase III subunit delta' [Hyphomicrobiales bacterium]MDE2114066.1 DNA polymerase III subunit delta' [Hyphomicrobiales bacterium]
MSRDADALPDSDRFGDAPAPRETMALLGHALVEREWLNAYRDGNLPQALLIGGAQGVGKATLAWRLARFILAHPDHQSAAVAKASDLDVRHDHPVAQRIAQGSHGDVSVLRREWNPQSKKHYSDIRIDDVRKMMDRFKLAAGEGGWRIAIIDSCEDLNRSGANALLKLIEEPPPKSLFLIVAHRPGQVLPTIRSRCRKVMLNPLTAGEVAGAVKASGHSGTPAAILQASERSGGSVREALRLLEGGSLALDAKLGQMLRQLPKLDGREVYAIADQCVRAGQDAAFETLVQALFHHLHTRVHAMAGQGEPIRNLEPMAAAFNELRQSLRDAEIYNLDKRSLIVGIFNRLAQSAR